MNPEVAVSIPSSPLPLAVIQLALEPELAANRAKIEAFVAAAARKGCRLVVTPKCALYAPPDEAKFVIENAVHTMLDTVLANQVFLVLNLMDRASDDEPLGPALRVIAPDGSVIAPEEGAAPPMPYGAFEIDGIGCLAIARDEGFARTPGHLSALENAQVVIDCANAALGERGGAERPWYVSEARQHGAHVVFANTATRPGEPEPPHLIETTGQSAVAAPNGASLAIANGEPDQLLIATIEAT